MENGIYKYTFGASTDYNSVRSKLKTVTAKFKDAFIIAFKNDKKVNVNEAIKEFLQNKESSRNNLNGFRPQMPTTKAFADGKCGSYFGAVPYDRKEGYKK